MRRFVLVLDPAAVLVFVAVGRENHGEAGTVSGLLETAAPFLIAMAVGWLGIKAWRSPLGWRTGVAVWIITVAGGMLLRNLAFGEGTAASFIVVATVFLGLLLTGWRGVLVRLGAAPSSPDLGVKVTDAA